MLMSGNELDFEKQPHYLDIFSIRVDGGTQPRHGLNQAVVSEYAEAMLDGAVFPAVTVFYDGTTYWLADGYHRLQAARKAELTKIAAKICQGSRRDAVLYSVGANANHGLRRTNADKRRAVETLLRDEEWSQWSDREIARCTGLSNRFVSNLRSELTVNCSQSTHRRGADGRTINTTNIGRSGKETATQVVLPSQTTNTPLPELCGKEVETFSQSLVPELMAGNKHLLTSLARNSNISSETELPKAETLFNQASITQYPLDAAVTEIALCIKDLTLEQLTKVITTSANNGFSDNQLKTVIEAATQVLNQRHYAENSPGS